MLAGKGRYLIVEFDREAARKLGDSHAPAFVIRPLPENVAIYRQQVIGRNRIIMRWLPHRGGALDFADWKATHPGKPFPVLVAIGADPATLLAAVAPIPDTLSEYEFAGLLRGQRTRV